VKINLKNKKGFTTVDLSIAMIVIVMFVVIMTSVSYNIYTSSTEAKRTAIALNYGVDIFEHIGALNYNEVIASYDLFKIDGMENFEHIATSSNDKESKVSGKIGTYEFEVKIQDYKNEGLIKIITLTIKYPVSKKNTETIELQRLKIIEEV